ncbi:MAG: hypothetical protein A2Y34_16400 [Spirochaetes bacterium GWC1_27_15]|nr:MAG: hypothetical protein A2Z98_09360 [Spirochaetes bacterium GWB1_27_13]OHD24372.1 MAG: hypothetical protein A2Y34_16400 [Spirochaetes bacterium GWC1_27_15]
MKTKKYSFFYFKLFLLISSVVFLLYYLNLFLFPSTGFKFNILKIIYIFVYSVFLSLYLLDLIFHNKTKGRIILFISVILLLFFLKDFKQNILWNFIFRENESVYSLFEVFFGFFSFALLLVSFFIQRDFVKIESLKIKKEKNKTEEHDIFL